MPLGLMPMMQSQKSIDTAKEVAEKASADIAKVAGEITQCVAMGAKAYTFVRVLQEILEFAVLLIAVLGAIYLLNKWLDYAYKE